MLRYQLQNLKLELCSFDWEFINLVNCCCMCNRFMLVLYSSSAKKICKSNNDMHTFSIEKNRKYDSHYISKCAVGIRKFTSSSRNLTSSSVEANLSLIVVVAILSSNLAVALLSLGVAVSSSSCSPS